MIDEWMIDTDEIEIYYHRILGKGEFGIVYEGKWRGIIVAVKQFKDLDNRKIKLMQNEFLAMTKLHHPNIIQLLGYIKDPFTIIMEYISNGSLLTYLKKKKRISLATKINFMIDIALGLEYLHQRKPSYIIHRDIKPSNFLITKDLHVKITDFGICKILCCTESMISKSYDNNMNHLQNIEGTSNVGTLFYMAPELIKKSQNQTIYNSNVDIYSFGSVMYEVFEKMKIFEYSSSRDEFIQHILMNDIPRFKKTPLFIQNLILQCLNHDQKSRPNALYILNHLRLYLNKNWWTKFYYF